ncbi:MAG: hypothetical protein HFI32_12105 [Lachnospiraceae bacterium]|nr:hypothetical protein [Lachnospiraceae bacterium]
MGEIGHIINGKAGKDVNTYAALVYGEEQDGKRDSRYFKHGKDSPPSFTPKACPYNTVASETHPGFNLIGFCFYLSKYPIISGGYC